MGTGSSSTPFIAQRGSMLLSSVLFYDFRSQVLEVQNNNQVLSFAAIDAQGLYAAPSHLVCSISGDPQSGKGAHVHDMERLQNNTTSFCLSLSFYLAVSLPLPRPPFSISWPFWPSVPPCLGRLRSRSMAL
jgi:hypothetical protein